MSSASTNISVVIVYSSRFGKEWKTYIEKELNKSLGNGVNMISIQQEKIPPPLQDRVKVTSNTRCLIGSGVLIVILTDDHVEYLLEHPVLDYKQALQSNALSFSPEDSYLFYFREVNFKQVDSKGIPLENRFEQFHKWKRILYTNERSIDEMGRCIKEIRDKLISNSSTSHKAKMTNNIVKCDESTVMTIVFDNELPPIAKVQVYLNLPGNPTNFPVETKICNPYVVTFKTFEHVEGEVRVTLMVDSNEAFLEPRTLRYVSSSNEINTVSQFYIELLEILMRKLIKLHVDSDSMDDLMSSVFTSSHIPVQAFEFIFSLVLDSGYLLTESCDSSLPTLLHLGASHGLKNFCSTLHDLPNAQCALEKSNDKGQLPEDLADKAGYRDLASFLEDSRKGNLDDLYIKFVQRSNFNDADDKYLRSRVKYLKRKGTRNEKSDETQEPEYIFCDQVKTGCLPSNKSIVNKQLPRQISKEDKKSNRISEELLKLFRKFISKELNITKTEFQFEGIKSKIYGGCLNFDEKKKNAKLLRDQIGRIKQELKKEDDE